MKIPRNNLLGYFLSSSYEFLWKVFEFLIKKKPQRNAKIYLSMVKIPEFLLISLQESLEEFLSESSNAIIYGRIPAVFSCWIPEKSCSVWANICGPSWRNSSTNFGRLSEGIPLDNSEGISVEISEKFSKILVFS